jgi:hypothetical protein
LYNYSFRNDSTGLAVAAFIDRAVTVSQAIVNTNPPASIRMPAMIGKTTGFLMGIQLWEIMISTAAGEKCSLAGNVVMNPVLKPSEGK